MIIRIIDEVKKSIDNECFIAALSLALMIPDICGKAEYPELQSQTKKRYIKWYNTHIGYFEKPTDSDDMPYPSGEIIYSLRNSLFHQGTPNIALKDIKKEEQCKANIFILTISDVADGGFSSIEHGSGHTIINRSLEINIVNLCNKLCLAGKHYYWDNKENFDFFQYKLEDRRNT